jgi:hypothetical protein
MEPAMPASPLAALEVSKKSGSSYPEPFRSRMGDGTWRALGDSFGLTQFGFNLETLEPARNLRCGTGIRCRMNSSTCSKASWLCA